MEKVLVRGITLVEVILALLIVSLVLLAALTLLPSSLVAVRRSETQLRAEALAQSVLEQQRSLPFTALVLDSSYAQDVGDLRAEVSILRAADADPARAKQIRVSVGWTYKQRRLKLERALVVAPLAR